MTTQTIAATLAIQRQTSKGTALQQWTQTFGVVGPTGPFQVRTWLNFHYFCASDSVAKWCSRALAGDIPIFFYRCAVTRELFDLLIKLRPSSTAGTLAENIWREWHNYNFWTYLMPLMNLKNCTCLSTTGGSSIIFKLGNHVGQHDREWSSSAQTHFASFLIHMM